MAHIAGHMSGWLTNGQDQALRVLEAHPARWMTPREIADFLGHKQPTGVGKALWALRKMGEVETPSGPDHGRIWRVSVPALRGAPTTAHTEER